MLVNDDRAAGQGASPAHLVDLQAGVLEADGVVAADSALELERKDQVQIALRAVREAAGPQRTDRPRTDSWSKAVFNSPGLLKLRRRSGAIYPLPLMVFFDIAVVL